MIADRRWLDKPPVYVPPFWTTRQGKASQLFGDRLPALLAELNERLAA